MGSKGFENIDGTKHKCKALQKSYSIQSNVPRDSSIQEYNDDKIARLEIEISKLQKENFEIRDELNCVLALLDFHNKRKAGKRSIPPTIETTPNLKRMVFSNE